MGKEIVKAFRKRDYVTDAVGQMSINALGILVGQLTYFYTNKIGISAAMAGTILLAARVVDALSDIAMGKIVDKTYSKQGKARPWLLRMLIPLPLSIILLYTVPQVSASMQIGYGILTNIFASAICYTAVAVPYYALINYTTKDSQERGKIGVARQLASYIIGFGITITILPVTNWLGGDQRAWIIYVSVIALIAFFSLIICYKGTKERYSDSDEEQKKEREVTLVRALWMLLHNKYWVSVTITMIFMQLLYAMINIAPVYYCQYVLGNENLYSIFSMLGLVASLVGFAVSPLMIKKYGMIKTARNASIYGIAGCAIRCFFPSNMTVALICYGLILFATVPMISVLPIATVNTVEYNKYKYNLALCGMTGSTNSFAGKVGSGIGSALIGWILAWGGFNAKLKVQSVAAIRSIYGINIWIPLVMFIIMFIILYYCDLDEKYEFFVSENMKRRREV